MKKTDFEWQQECKFIDSLVDKKGVVPNMNNDTPTFIRYCEMQRDAAGRDGQFDASTSIQHVIDDMQDYAQSVDTGYLHHGKGTAGPFRTESVKLRHEAPDNWFARFEGKWRKVNVQVNRTFIVFQGEKIDIQIWGV